MPLKIIIGSRGSDLALWQANYVMNKLRDEGVQADIKVIKTLGDKVQLSWDKIEGKGFFTKEIEDALLRGEIDLAVHSHKDLPTEEPEGLIVAAVSEREDPGELLLIDKQAADDKQKFSLKSGAVVGTSSARRKSQLLAWRPDLKTVDLRGNVPTRIQKLREKQCEAILIANAGVARLELDISDFYSENLDPKEFIPAPAQGVLAIQMRDPAKNIDVLKPKNKTDRALYEIVKKLNHPDVEEVVYLERKVMNLFQGGCQLPLGVYCELAEDDSGNKRYCLHAAKSEVKNPGFSFPKYFYFESGKNEGFAEKLVNRMLNSSAVLSKKNIFISRNEKNNDFFKRCLEAQGMTVFCRSLIDIKPVPFNKNIQADWVFFSSKNSVKYFMEQKPVLGNIKIGAVGKSTAEEIRKYGKRADFIGSSDDTRLTGKKFSALVGNKIIVFPQAKDSMKTIQLQLPGKQNVKNLVVYETIKNAGPRNEISSFEVLVFTSPSNVDAFYENNIIGSHQKVVAMGEATSNALRKHGIRAHRQPPTFDDLGLVKAVFSMDI